MEIEIKELRQALIRFQQNANAYKKENEVWTERITELEARLREHGKS
jgi:FtsZ-binding cell division protein ZapB